MTLPLYRYRDPARVAEVDQVHELKLEKGCAVCGNREAVVLDKGVCGVGKRPGPKGFCKSWHYSDAGCEDGR